jgi:hypothetical protein
VATTGDKDYITLIGIILTETCTWYSMEEAVHENFSVQLLSKAIIDAFLE